MRLPEEVTFQVRETLLWVSSRKSFEKSVGETAPSHHTEGKGVNVIHPSGFPVDVPHKCELSWISD